jgi:FkbM family methyltransferase
VDAGKWEPATLEAIEALSPGGLVVDVGAWIGPTVLAAAPLATRVIAYEPDPVAAEELRSNVERNGLTNVEVRQVALFDRDGELPLSPGMLDELGLSVSSLVYGPASVSVRARDARSEVQAPEFGNAALLKIDVEGAEYRLIGRIAPFLRQHQPALLLSLHSVRWQDRHLVRGPRWLNNFVRRVANAGERAPLLWRIRRYKHWYLDRAEGWKPLTWMERWTLVAAFGEQELLLSDDPYPGAVVP